MILRLSIENILQVYGIKKEVLNICVVLVVCRTLRYITQTQFHKIIYFNHIYAED